MCSVFVCTGDLSIVQLTEHDKPFSMLDFEDNDCLPAAIATATTSSSSANSSSSSSSSKPRGGSDEVALLRALFARLDIDDSNSVQTLTTNCIRVRDLPSLSVNDLSELQLPLMTRKKLTAYITSTAAATASTTAATLTSSPASVSTSPSSSSFSSSSSPRRHHRPPRRRHLLAC